MEDHNVKVTVLTSGCPKYKAGDEIYFNGAFIDKEKSANLCMVALSAIYPFVYAARRGGSVKESPVQCPDCGEAVTFKIKRLD
ncbi:MAG: TIGR04076 family protein [Synergistes sp.]|nr:TIGR04076 family protein [Synergistes sp.]